MICDDVQGVYIGEVALQSSCLRYSHRNVSLFYRIFAIISCSRTAVLLYWYMKSTRNNECEFLLANQSQLGISIYFLSSCLGLRVPGSQPSQSSLPVNSDPDRHHVVLQKFAYETATQREAKSTSGYRYVKSFNLLTRASVNSGKFVVLN